MINIYISKAWQSYLLSDFQKVGLPNSHKSAKDQRPIDRIRVISTSLVRCYDTVTMATAAKQRLTTLPCTKKQNVNFHFKPVLNPLLYFLSKSEKPIDKKRNRMQNSISNPSFSFHNRQLNVVKL